MKKNSGQSMIEALFVVVFTTIIMFSFIQLCVMVVDDMSANEAAFVAMRSAAVTGGTATDSNSDKAKEAKNRVETYMVIFYPLSIAVKGDFSPSKFAYSDKNSVDSYFHDSNNDDTGDDDSGDSVTIYKNDDSGNKSSDYDGYRVQSYTVKVYYFTRIMFGSIVAKLTSTKDFLYSGSRRYQSARSRMVPSPDWRYYNKAFPEADNFEK